jgi:hypothetical protein
MTGPPRFPPKGISPDMPENAITERIIKCAIAVHRELGPGLLENVYEEALDVERFDPVFEAQVLTYLRITGKRVGLLINFNSRLVKDGIKRFIL